MIGKNILFVLLNKAIKQDSGGSGIDGSYAKLDYTGITNSNFKYAVTEISDLDLSTQTTCGYAFSGFGNLEKIGKVKTSTSCTSLASMYESCAKLTSIDLSEIVSTNVTLMSSMFQYDTNITSIDFSSFDTNKVTDMSNLFRNCTHLESITFGTGFTLSKCVSANSLQNMFVGCNVLSNTTLSNIIDLLVTYGGSSNKTLKYIGLSSTQATTCTGLSNWSALEANGWTTGY